MFYFAGVGVAGFTHAVVLQNMPFTLLKNSVGSSGGALALAALCARDVDGMSATLQDIYKPGSILNTVALKGAAQRREALMRWAAATTTNGEITFGEWGRDTRRMSFRVLVFNCLSCRPEIMDMWATPNMPIVDALCAATSWPALSDCHKIGDIVYCDVEFLVGPLVLNSFFYRPAMLTVQGICTSLNIASPHDCLSRAIAHGEYYGAWLRANEVSRYPVFSRKGPHVADHLISGLQEICARHESYPLSESGIAMLLITSAVLCLLATTPDDKII